MKTLLFFLYEGISNNLLFFVINLAVFFLIFWRLGTLWALFLTPALYMSFVAIMLFIYDRDYIFFEITLVLIAGHSLILSAMFSVVGVLIRDAVRKRKSPSEVE